MEAKFWDGVVGVVEKVTPGWCESDYWVASLPSYVVCDEVDKFSTLAWAVEYEVYVASDTGAGE